MSKAVTIAFVVLLLMPGLTGCVAKWSAHETYTEVGTFQFFCTAISRQPSMKSTGGYDAAKGIYWSGIEETMGYAHMQTDDRAYGFYLMISPAEYVGPDHDLVQIDDVAPIEAVVLRDSQGNLVYIDSEETLKRYEEGNYLHLTGSYYAELPEN